MHKVEDVVGYLFEFGVDVLASTLDPTTGTITLQLGDVAQGRADSNNAEMWQGASGICSRPALPTQGKASCQVCVIKKSDRDMPFAYRDLRATAIYANLEPGATCLYATAGQAREVCKADGSARQMTTDDNTETGNAVFAGISSVWQSPSGPQPGGEWRYYAPWGGAWQDPSGYHLRTWHGVKIDAGGVVLPAPLGLSGSTYTLSSDMVSLDAAMLSLGRNNGTAQALVQALPLQSLMATFAGEIAAFTSVVTTFAGAVATYALGIQATVDPTHALTPALTGACTAMATAAQALAAQAAATLGQIVLATATKATTAS
jgi:hypothetical protein